MESTVEIKLHDLSALESAASEFLEQCSGKKKFAFYGNLGAGKTTFIKAVCKQLGVNSNMSSPTFALVNEYEGRQTVYHLDLYRLKDEEEALDMGIEHYLYSDTFCFVEWPEVIENILPAEMLKVEIAVNGDQRTIVIHEVSS